MVPGLRSLEALYIHLSWGISLVSSMSSSWLTVPLVLICRTQRRVPTQPQPQQSDPKAICSPLDGSSRHGGIGDELVSGVSHYDTVHWSFLNQPPLILMISLIFTSQILIFPAPLGPGRSLDMCIGYTAHVTFMVTLSRRFRYWPLGTTIGRRLMPRKGSRCTWLARTIGARPRTPSRKCLPFHQ